MPYNVDYEVCALLFLVTLTVWFYRKKLFPSLVNRLFGVIMLCAIADLALDILGSPLIEDPSIAPIWVNYLVNGTFYLLQVLFPALMMTYIMLLIGPLREWGYKALLLYIPAAIDALLLLSSPLTGLIYSVKATAQGVVYLHGPVFLWLYVGTAFYLAVTLVLVRANRGGMGRAQYATVHIILLIIAAAVVVQFLYPQYLLTGVAMALSIFLMYLTLQQPEEMLDYTTSAFNFGGLVMFLRDRQREGKTLGIVALEIDGLRRINSLFGLEAGNRVMVQLGAFLMDNDAHGWVFRVFGTRFVVVTCGVEEYRESLERITKRFAEPWEIAEKPRLLGVSVRHFTTEGLHLAAEDMIALIDGAFADIEGSGLGVVELERAYLESTQRRMAVEEVLRHAVEDGEGFSLHFQPLLTPEGTFRSAEVLLRFSHLRLGAVSPAEFIPAAEKSGLITRIDEMVVRRACDFLCRYGDELEAMGLAELEINLSAAEFMLKDLPQGIISIVSEYGVDPGKLVFEITETAATSVDNMLLSHMQTLRQAGFRFALDDFGTGYANISRVVSLPFSTIKMDRPLLLEACAGDGGVLESLLAMFKRLGLFTTVEGVETQQQAAYAEKLGADYLQGFYYAMPMPEEAFVAFLRRENRKPS